MLEVDEDIWVGTDQGLFIFDPFRETFTHFNLQAQNKESISTAVNSIIKDKDGNIWIASFGQGLFFYDVSKKVLINFQHTANLLSSLSSNIIWTLYCDSQGDVWVGTLNGGLNRFDKQNSSFTRFMASADAGSLGDNNVYSIFEDREKNLWVGTWADGLKRMDKARGTFNHYRHTPKKNSISHNTIRAISEIEKGRLLIGTELGMNILDTRTGEFSLYQNNIEKPGSLSDNAVYSLFSDSEGGLWVGTYFGGINYGAPRLKPFEHFIPGSGPHDLKGKAISEFLEDESGNFWIGTEDGGLQYFNPTNKTFKNFKPDTDGEGLSYHNIHALLIDEGKLWIGTFTGGLDVMDLETGRFRNYQPNSGDPNSLTSDCIYSLYRDNTGRIWVGTISGLIYYNREKDHFNTVHQKGLSSIYIIDILQDTYGYIWFASYGEGVFRYDARNNLWENFRHFEINPQSISHNKVISIFQDDMNRLWFGTEGGGVSRFIYSENNFISFKEGDGLPNNVTYGILDDIDGNIWISTNNGLSRFNPETGAVKNFTKADGLQSNQFNYKSRYKASDGKLYFGGVNGFNAFYPQDLQDNEFIPPVVINNLQLFNIEVPIGVEKSPLQHSINKTSRIVLSPSQSVISFGFVSLSYISPEKNQYAYIMEGFETDWNYVTGQRRASYTNLAPGEYVFRVLASNNDGVWNTEGAVLEVVVLPPFWKTKWAYATYFLFILGVLLTYRWYFVRKTYRKHRKKLEKIQAEKDKEITQMKFDFFINIAHEIRTPLTLIRGPLEKLLSSDTDKQDRKLQYELMEKNSRQLLNLVNHLLDFRKIENGNYFLNYSDFDLKDLIEEICSRFSPVADQKKIVFNFHHDQGDYRTSADPEAITHILSNLLTNSFKYTKDEVKVTLSAKSENASGPPERYELEVKDNGSGIHKSELNKVFLPFYQVNTALNKNSIFSGTGLGLSYVKTLVELHNGEIILKSEPNMWTAFTVFIPYKLPENPFAINPDNSYVNATISLESNIDLPNAEMEDLSETTGHKENFKINSPNILIVDDSEDLLRFLYSNLHNDYNILTASNGEESWKIIRKRHLDLVISDVMMPVMEGTELCQLIKNDFYTSHIPVILLTAKSSAESKIEGLECGADVYLEKPFSVDILKAQIKSILNNRKFIVKKFSRDPFVKASIIAQSLADKTFLDNVTAIIEENVSNPDFSVEDLAQIISVSRSGLQKKLKAISGLSPNEFIRLIRLKKAASLLSDGSNRINEVCFLTGFNSPSYFSKCFQQHFGLLPKEFQKNISH